MKQIYIEEIKIWDASLSGTKIDTGNFVIDRL